jgi:hypothetical protein
MSTVQVLGLIAIAIGFGLLLRALPLLRGFRGVGPTQARQRIAATFLLAAAFLSATFLHGRLGNALTLGITFALGLPGIVLMHLGTRRH